MARSKRSRTKSKTARPKGRAKPARASGTRKPARPRTARARRPEDDAIDIGAGEMPLHLSPPAVLTGGDVDADRERAWDSGDEAVGGSVITPDQDVVDELGRALGVEQAPDEEVRASAEILRERDRHRWRQEP